MYDTSKAIRYKIKSFPVLQKLTQEKNKTIFISLGKSNSIVEQF